VFASGESASFLTLNRGKRSIALDLGDDGDRARLEQLLGEADVLVENMKPGTLGRFSLAYDDVRERFPRLVYCSISAFGQTGPDASQGGYDLTVQALSGIMSMNGHPDQPPAKVPVAALDFGSALYGVIGILAALSERDRTGAGQWVQTSILGTGLAWLSMHITTFLLGGGEPQPLGSRSPFFAPYEAYRAADGYLVIVGTGGKAAWSDLCEVLGLPQLVDAEHFADNSARVANAESLRVEIERVLGTRPTAEWVERLERAGIPCAPVQSLPQVLDSDQVAALGALDTLTHPVAGEVPIVRLPVLLSDSPSTATQPPPLLGEHADVGFGDGGR
jgi:formyl-CoA transferase/CoA:oxalate CoA-transferase